MRLDEIPLVGGRLQAAHGVLAPLRRSQIQATGFAVVFDSVVASCNAVRRFPTGNISMPARSSANVIVVR